MSAICCKKKLLLPWLFFAGLAGSQLTGWALLKKRILFFDNVGSENVNLLKRLIIWWPGLKNLILLTVSLVAALYKFTNLQRSRCLTFKPPLKRINTVPTLT